MKREANTTAGKGRTLHIMRSSQNHDLLRVHCQGRVSRTLSGLVPTPSYADAAALEHSKGGWGIPRRQKSSHHEKDALLGGKVTGKNTPNNPSIHAQIKRGLCARSPLEESGAQTVVRTRERTPFAVRCGIRWTTFTSHGNTRPVDMFDTYH